MRQHDDDDDERDDEPDHSDNGSEFMTTGLVARKLRCTEGTVRSYDRRGILSTVRTATGMRLYLRRDVERLAAQRRAGR